MPLSLPVYSSEGKNPGHRDVLKFFLLLYIPMALALSGLLYGFLSISAPAVSLAQFPRALALYLVTLILLALLAYYLAWGLSRRRQLRQAVAENEARLWKRNGLLERIFSNVQAHLAYLDPDFNFIRVNQTYAAADGKIPEFFPGKNHFTLYPNTENEAIFRNVVESGVPYVAYAKPFEYPEHPERGVTYWDWSLVPVKGEADKVVGLLLSLTNATPRKRIEEERLRAEAKFHMVFDNAGDAIVIHNVEGRFLEVNRIMCERLGYSRDELLQLSPCDINVLEQAEKFEQRGKELRAHGQISFETVHVAKNGRHIPVEVIARLIDFGGQPATLSVMRDITQRKRAEAALRQSEERGRALLNATTETAMLMDKEGTVLAINETGARRFGKRPGDMIGHNFYAMLPPDLAASRAERVNEVFSTGQSAHLQDKRDDFYFDSHIYPTLDAEGQVSQVAIYAADITEKAQLQAVDTLLHEIDQQVLRSKSLALLLHFICADMVLLFGYRFAWIGRKSADGSVTIAAWAGEAEGYHDELERIGVRWDDTPLGQGPAGTTIRSGHAQVFRFNDPSFRPWRESAERFDLRAVISTPLIIRGEVYGAFTLYSQHEHSFDAPATLQRLNNIADRICVALENALDQKQLRLLGAALSAAGNGVFITNRHGRIRWVNASFSRLTGYGVEEAVGETPSLLKSGKQDDAYYQTLWKTILQGDPWSSETVERRRDGTLFTVQQTITSIRGEEGEITHFISILEDITAQKETESRIQYMAHFDALTDLPNRALFYDRLHQVLTLAKRDKHPFALMFLDLDRFKVVNDTLGHHMGDLLLQGVAQRLRECMRESDTVARLAGDEFTVLLPRVDGREGARIVAEKIVATLSRPFLLDSNEVCTSSSIGIVLYPADGEEDDDLVKNADLAMYTAKQKGRNSYCFFDASVSDSL